MKEITAFISSLGGGGAQGVFVTVMNDYARAGYAVRAVVDELDNDVYSSKLDSRITIVELGARSAKQSLPKLYRFLRQNNVEVAFAFSPEIAVNLFLCKKALRQDYKIIARCINTLSYEYRHAEGFFRRWITGPVVKLFYHKADHVVAQAQNMKKDLICNYGFREEQVTTINNPLASKYENREMVRKERGKYLLYVGRIEKQKGLDMLLKAYSQMKRKDIKLYLVGKGSKKEELMALSERLAVSDRVSFIDFTTDIEGYYENALCTVLSSLFEGFPNVLTESIACGTPVVAFDLPSGPEDIILPGINGYLARYRDVDDLARCMDAAVERVWDYKQVQQSSHRFSEESILPKYRELIERYI